MRLLSQRVLPDCGSEGCQKEAAYYAPTKYGLWACMCEKCSHVLRDYRFKTGYQLMKAAQRIFDVKEITPIELVAMGKTPRVVACELCRTQFEVGEYFEDEVTCKGCTVRLKVNKIYGPTS